MVLCVFVTVFLIASCWAESSPECEAVVKQLSKHDMKNVFDVMPPSQVSAGSWTYTFRVKDTSLTNWGEGGLYVSEKTCESERLNEESQITRFIMKMIPYTVNGTIMVQEEMFGKWTETTFNSEAVNGGSWRIQVLIDNKWNVQDLQYLDWDNNGWKQIFQTSLSGCPLEKTKMYCKLFGEAINIRLRDTFQERMREAIEDVMRNQG